MSNSCGGGGFSASTTSEGPSALSLAASGAGDPNEVQRAHRTALPVQTGLLSLSGTDGFEGASTPPLPGAFLPLKMLTLSGSGRKLVNSCGRAELLGISAFFIS